MQSRHSTLFPVIVFRHTTFRKVLLHCSKNNVDENDTKIDENSNKKGVEKT
jgi:hypothetical protein